MTRKRLHCESAAGRGTVEAIWRRNLVAVHCPGDGSRDSTSLDPADHSGSDRGTMKRFVELARLGGYVWADFRSGVTRFAKVGRVVPGTRVRLVNARWTDTGTPQVQ